MKRIVIFSALVLLASVAVGADVSDTFYVQLIRGTDTEKPPQPGCQRAGPKLSATFQPVFKWKSYWEITRKKVTVRTGQKARLRLSSEREVEIDLGQPKERKVTAFLKGDVTDRTISPAGEHMTIIGGNREPKSAWFIVVRRDKPKVVVAGK